MAGTSESARIEDLEQEIRELRRANEILKRAASFFGAELDRQHEKRSPSSTRTSQIYADLYDDELDDAGSALDDTRQGLP